MIAVTKIRGGQHNQDLRKYEGRERGLVGGEILSDTRGIITGVAHREIIRSSGIPPVVIGGT